VQGLVALHVAFPTGNTAPPHDGGHARSEAEGSLTLGRFDLCFALGRP
jgi:hypothetical protein